MIQKLMHYIRLISDRQLHLIVYERNQSREGSDAIDLNTMQPTLTRIFKHNLMQESVVHLFSYTLRSFYVYNKLFHNTNKSFHLLKYILTN